MSRPQLGNSPLDELSGFIHVSSVGEWSLSERPNLLAHVQSKFGIPANDHRRVAAVIFAAAQLPPVEENYVDDNGDVREHWPLTAAKHLLALGEYPDDLDEVIPEVGWTLRGLRKNDKNIKNLNPLTSQVLRHRMAVIAGGYGETRNLIYKHEHLIAYALFRAIERLLTLPDAAERIKSTLGKMQDADKRVTIGPRRRIEVTEGAEMGADDLAAMTTAEAMAKNRADESMYTSPLMDGTRAFGAHRMTSEDRESPWRNAKARTATELLAAMELAEKLRDVDIPILLQRSRETVIEFRASPINSIDELRYHFGRIHDVDRVLKNFYPRIFELDIADLKAYSRKRWDRGMPAQQKYEARVRIRDSVPRKLSTRRLREELPLVASTSRWLRRNVGAPFPPRVPDDIDALYEASCQLVFAMHRLDEMLGRRLGESISLPLGELIEWLKILTERSTEFESLLKTLKAQDSLHEYGLTSKIVELSDRYERLIAIKGESTRREFEVERREAVQKWFMAVANNSAEAQALRQAYPYGYQDEGRREKVAPGIMEVVTESIESVGALLAQYDESQFSVAGGD